MIKKLFSIVTVIFCLQTALFASEKDDQIIYAMLMNQIQYSLLTVQHYKSRVVLEKEYDNIICKIDKTKLADENGEAIEAYSNLLDTLTELKLGENEKQFLTIQAEKERKQSFTKVLEGAPSAVGMAAIAFAGGNPVQAVSGLLFTGVSAVFNYRNAVNSVENSLNASLFRISQNDIHILDGERNSLFKTYSRFITKYKIPKKYEIKEDQMKWLVESLDSLDAASKVRLLETKKDIFEVFTPFWFFLGSAYQEVGNEKKAKECYAEFEKQKRKYSIIDNDTYYTELAKNMIKMCHDDNREGKMKPYIAIIEADQTVASENENRLASSVDREQNARARRRPRKSVTRGLGHLHRRLEHRLIVIYQHVDLLRGHFLNRLFCVHGIRLHRNQLVNQRIENLDLADRDPSLIRSSCDPRHMVELRIDDI